MQCNLIDGAFHTTPDLTSTAVCVLVIDQNKCNKIMPEISFKSMTYCKFGQLVKTFVKQCLDILSVIIFILIVFHDPCHVIK